MNDVMPGSDGLEFLVILNKSSVDFSDLGEAGSLWTAGCASALVRSVS